MTVQTCCTYMYKCIIACKIVKWLIKMEVHAYGHNKYFEILPHVLSKQLQN